MPLNKPLKPSARMSERPRIDGLEVAQDLRFERRSWRIERAGWGVLALLIVAALAGLLGGGPLSSATEATGDGTLAIEFERFARTQSPISLRVRYRFPGRGGEIRVWLTRDYLRRARIREISPRPKRVEAGEDRLIYVFEAKGERRGTVIFQMEHENFGLFHGRAGVGSASLAFRQYIYP